MSGSDSDELVSGSDLEVLVLGSGSVFLSIGFCKRRFSIDPRIVEKGRDLPTLLLCIRIDNLAGVSRHTRRIRPRCSLRSILSNLAWQSKAIRSLLLNRCILEEN